MNTLYILSLETADLAAQTAVVSTVLGVYTSELLAQCGGKTAHDAFGVDYNGWTLTSGDEGRRVWAGSTQHGDVSYEFCIEEIGANMLLHG